MLRFAARALRASAACPPIAPGATAPRPCPHRHPQACTAATAAPSGTPPPPPPPPPCRLQIDPAHIVSSPHPIELPEERVQDFVWADLHRWPNNVAVECGVTGRRLTYSQLRDASRRLAVALRSPRLLGPSSSADTSESSSSSAAPVAAVINNSPEFAVVLLAALEAGAALSPVNPSYTAEEVARQLIDCGARVVFVDGASLSLTRAASELLSKEKKEAPPLLVLVGPGDATDGVVRLDDLAGPGAPLDAPGMTIPTPDTLAVLPYSSGTTGLPKGVLLPHRTIAANLRQVQHPEVSVVREAQGSDQESVPAVLPFFHIYGQVVVLMCSLCEGAKIVTLPSFQPESFIRTMITHKASVMFAVPPLVLFLASEYAPAKALEHLHVVFSGAAPLGLADVDRLKARAHPDLLVMQGYGMTEASPVVLQGRADNAGAVGLPVPVTEAVVVDSQTGISLPPNQEGELCFRGPQIMKGYWQRPEATAATLAEDGWMLSGDIGHTDDVGDFLIVDRAKELIKVKGFQVAPAELEALLRSLPGVADAAVVATPDERAGEVPLAYVVPKGPQSPPDAAAARAFCRRISETVAEQVAPHKRLSGGVRLVASIPKNASGKILRRELRKHPPPELLESSTS